MDILNVLFFYIIAAMLILSAFLLVVLPRIVHSLVCAVVFFIFIGFVYFMLNASYNGVSQIMIYAIGVSLLLLFAIMLTPYHAENKLWIAKKPRTILIFGAVGIIFISIVSFFAFQILQDGSVLVNNPANLLDLNTLYPLSTSIFTNYVFAFELFSVFLLIAMVGIGSVVTLKKSGGRQK